MNTELVLEKLRSKKSALMWEGSSEILRCHDIQYLLPLQPYCSEIRASLDKIKMGGIVISHRKTIQLALDYIENRCQGRCRCSLYLEESYISPISEKKRGFLRIKESKVLQHEHEEHFWIVCHSCGNEFKVIEIIGGHVPFYHWNSLTEKKEL